MRRATSTLTLAFIFVSLFVFAFDIQPVKSSGPIYIRADGSIHPPTTIISTVDNVTYILTGNITSETDGIIVERGNITIDGSGHTLQGPWDPWAVTKGLFISDVFNVTIIGMNIYGFYHGVYTTGGFHNISISNFTSYAAGIFLSSSYNSTVRFNRVEHCSYDAIVAWYSDNITISNNNIASNGGKGIYIGGGKNNIVSDNKLENNEAMGIAIAGSTGNIVSRNDVSNGTNDGFYTQYSTNNSISENSLSHNAYGVNSIYGSGNVFSGNNISYNIYGVWLNDYFGTVCFGNNFLNNTYQVAPGSANTWDLGYPSGGNCWSDYNGTDLYSGPYQNETGCDGIGDTPYIIDENNIDNYPLKPPWTLTEAIYIRADGSIEPESAPISTADNITYTLTNNIFGDVLGGSSAIVVEKDNIVIDGAGYTVQGPEDFLSIGLDLSQRNNVTLINVKVSKFYYGIYLSDSNNNILTGNNAQNNGRGIALLFSNNNILSNNNASDNDLGITLLSSNNNFITDNNVLDNGYGITLYVSDNNTLACNTMLNNHEGVRLGSSIYNTSGNIVFFHNSLINNTYQTSFTSGHENIWDDDYPSGGNYWSDYIGLDADGDGIGDTPYIIDEENVDRYPLMSPYVQPVGDINGDGWVNGADAVLIGLSFGLRQDDPDWNPDTDLNDDGYVNAKDVVILGSHFNEH